MSLRARLLAILVALAALGLALGGAVSYAALRSYLLDKLDQQVVAALPQVDRALDQSQDSGGQQGQHVPDIGGPGHGGPGDVYVPPGTYGERRDATGTTIGSP